MDVMDHQWMSNISLSFTGLASLSNFEDDQEGEIMDDFDLADSGNVFDDDDEGEVLFLANLSPFFKTARKICEMAPLSFHKDLSMAEGGALTERMAARQKALGFVPQKEKIQNEMLPYSDRLDAESTENWRLIKTNLAKSVAVQEFRPGYVTWIGRLVQYIKLYR